MKVLGKNKGITLVALVVTIVVLLILAGISVSILIGQNGILNRATEAKEKTKASRLEEKIKLLTSEVMVEQYINENNAEITAEKLQDKLKEQEENVLVIQWDQYIIFDLDKNKEYRITRDGNLEYWGESTMGTTLLNAHTANSDQIAQDSSTSNIIGIDNDGNTVNMLLWEYTLIDNESLGKIGTYGLNDRNGLTAGQLERSAGYIGGYTSEGKIIGTVPTYISTDGGNTYVSVTSMVHTFYDCDDLIVAPEIANTITNMNLTFYQASNLTTSPSKIPDSVIDFEYAFANCEKLNSIPILGKNIKSMKSSFRYTAIAEFSVNIPNSVTNMSNTFRGCTSLKEFNTNIPNSVTDMSSTFNGCTVLQEFSVNIPNSVTNMSSTFNGCTSLKEFSTNVPNSVTNMSSTFIKCTALTKGPNEIPNSVTNMMQTFSYCTNLNGTIKINANLDGKTVLQYNGKDYADFEQCFLGTSTNGRGLIISKDSICAELNNLLNTKSSDSNIIIEE